MAARKAAHDQQLPGDYLMNATLSLDMPRHAARAVLRPAPEPLFRSAHDALVFAFNFSRQQYDRPLMNRVAAGPQPSDGRGLSGLDGAGQAAMTLAELGRLSPLDQALLIAGKAPQSEPCGCGVACCSGHKTNGEWLDAISVVTTAAIAGALSGCIVNRRLCAGLVQKHFGAKVSLIELAELCQVDRHTAGTHNGRIKRWLFGDGMGVFNHAINELERRLLASGVVGDKESC